MSCATVSDSHAPWAERPIHVPIVESLTHALLLMAFVVLALLAAAVSSGAVAHYWRFIERNLETSAQVGRFESKLDAVGFGLLIRFFFVTSGMALDLAALAGSARALAELSIFLALFIVVRGLPAVVLYRGRLDRTERRSLALLSAT